MIPLNYIIRKSTRVDKFTNSQTNNNYIVYIDDIKLLTMKMEPEAQTIRIYNLDIGMEFGNVSIPYWL